VEEFFLFDGVGGDLWVRWVRECVRYEAEFEAAFEEVCLARVFAFTDGSAFDQYRVYIAAAQAAEGFSFRTGQGAESAFQIEGHRHVSVVRFGYVRRLAMLVEEDWVGLFGQCVADYKDGYEERHDGAQEYFEVH
jgi:hypothetical protein